MPSRAPAACAYASPHDCERVGEPQRRWLTGAQRAGHVQPRPRNGQAHVGGRETGGDEAIAQGAHDADHALPLLVAACLRSVSEEVVALDRELRASAKQRQAVAAAAAASPREKAGATPAKTIAWPPTCRHMVRSDGKASCVIATPSSLPTGGAIHAETCAGRGPPRAYQMRCTSFLATTLKLTISDFKIAVESPRLGFDANLRQRHPASSRSGSSAAAPTSWGSVCAGDGGADGGAGKGLRVDHAHVPPTVRHLPGEEGINELLQIQLFLNSISLSIHHNLIL